MMLRLPDVSLPRLPPFQDVGQAVRRDVRGLWSGVEALGLHELPAANEPTFAPRLERVMQQVEARPAFARLAFRAMMAISSAARKLGLNPGKIFFRPVHRLLGPKMRYFIVGGSSFVAEVHCSCLLDPDGRSNLSGRTGAVRQVGRLNPDPTGGAWGQDWR